jgi:predicted TIM-barrel fold metal-dependent hydrolase
VDFIQESDGIHKLIEAMDAANVQKAVVFGLPVKKKWEAYEKQPPHYYLDDNSRCYYFHQTDEILAREFLSLPAAEQKRFAPLICGFNPTDRYGVRDVERMLKKYPFWRGIGEVFSRHDDLTNLTNEETARVNHPALFEIFELCADKKLPFLVHHNSTSVSIHDAYEHLHELEEVLPGFPRTTFVWAHCGISRRVFHKNYHQMLISLFEKYPNLLVDISWVVYDDVICLNLEPKKHWMDLIEHYPERFSIGSDLCGHFEHLGKTMARYNRLLQALDPKARRLVALENAERLWFGARESEAEAGTRR